jgi:hypothetical protein
MRKVHDVVKRLIYKTIKIGDTEATNREISYQEYFKENT